MKKIAAIALVACIAMVVMAAVPALADRQKPNLVVHGNYPKATGGGFVIFSNSKGTNNLHLTVSLKKADLSNEPSIAGTTTFDVWLGCNDGINPTVFTLLPGNLTINADGNGNYHINTNVPSPGTNLLAVFVRPAGSMSTVFETSYVPLTFK